MGTTEGLIWIALAVLVLVNAGMGWELYHLRQRVNAMQGDVIQLSTLRQQIETMRGLIGHVAEQIGPLNVKVDKLCQQDYMEDIVERKLGRVESQLGLLLSRQGLTVGSLNTGGGGGAVGGNVEDNRARNKRRRDGGELPKEEMP